MSRVLQGDRFNRTKWGGRMMGLARQVSTWSSCPPGRQHACVLAEDGRFVISTGYNGPLPGDSKCHCTGMPTEYCKANCKAVHAEVNALRNMPQGHMISRPLVAYVTKRPCQACFQALFDGGVDELCFAETDGTLVFVLVASPHLQFTPTPGWKE